MPYGASSTLDYYISAEVTVDYYYISAEANSWFSAEEANTNTNTRVLYKRG
jgi:hypothetical protein